MDALIFNTLRRVQAEQDEEKRAQLMAESNEELGRYFLRHPDAMEELAFDLFNLSFKDVQQGDLVRELFEVKDVGLGETDYIEEDLRGMRVYFQGKGGQILSDIIRYERAQMPREEMVGAIDMHQDEFALDFWGMLSKLQAQIREKMRTAPTERMIELTRDAVTGGTNYASIAAATISDADLDPVLDVVSEASDGQVTIVGTNIAIRKLAKVGLDFGQNLQERIFESGIIAVYKGYPVVQLQNWENFDGNKVLPNDELWLVGKRAGRVTYYGNTPKVQQLRLPSFYFRWETARDVGMSVYGVAKKRLGRVVLT